MADRGGQKERKKATLEVPSKGGEPPKEDEGKGKGQDEKPYDDNVTLVEMTEEERQLKERLDAAVESLVSEPSTEAKQAALETLRRDIRESTSTMTSVPKPLKFLAPHYDALKQTYEALPATKRLRAGSARNDNDELRREFADILSVLAMVKAATGRESLHFKLEGNHEDVGAWGHEYLRGLAGEIGAEFESVRAADAEADVSGLLELVHQIVPYNMQHNAEADAIDLLLETGELRTLVDATHVDADNHARVCLYLCRCSDYLSEPDEAHEALMIAYELYLRHNELSDALRVALRLSDRKLVLRTFRACTTDAMRKQLGFIIGWHLYRRRGFAHRGTEEDDEDDAEEGIEDEEVLDAVGNAHLSSHFLTLARQLDQMQPKAAEEDIYKSHLVDSGFAPRGADTPQLDSAQANLATSYVNAFVNCGFGVDKLITTDSSDDWIHKNKDYGKLASAASLGLVHLWNTDEVGSLDKFWYTQNESIKAGGVLGIGLCTANTATSEDPTFFLLEEHLGESEGSSDEVRAAALLSMGVAYAGTARRDVLDRLAPYIQDTTGRNAMELACLASLSMGLVFVGTAEMDATSIISDRLMDASVLELGHPLARHMALGLGLLFLGKGDAVEPILQVVDTMEHSMGKVASLLLKACAFAGTGNVLEVQHMLHLCAEHPEMEEIRKERERQEEEAESTTAAAGSGGTTSAGQGGAGAAAAAAAAAAGAGAGTGEGESGDRKVDARKFMHQSVATVGLAMISMGESLGVEMLTRVADHLLQYGDTAVRRAVPLALAVCHLSDPDFSVVDLLSKLTHDGDASTAQAAILAMGLCGAGTNNSRIAGLLRQLSTFYQKEANHLFIVRLSQGLLHMGKGLVTINPFHSDRTLMRQPAVASVMAVVLTGLDLEATLLSKYHYLLYALVPAIMPRMLLTLDEDTLESEPVDVRVGTGVETVGQAGRPKTITGFQTHGTPVLMSVTDRAELADQTTHEPLSNVLEGVVLLHKLHGGGAAESKDSS